MFCRGKVAASHYFANHQFCTMKQLNLISIQGKTNFFEKRVGEYSNIANPSGESEQVFSLNEDF